MRSLEALRHNVGIDGIDTFKQPEEESRNERILHGPGSILCKKCQHSINNKNNTLDRLDPAETAFQLHNHIFTGMLGMLTLPALKPR